MADPITDHINSISTQIQVPLPDRQGMATLPPETFVDTTGGFRRECVRTRRPFSATINSIAAFSATADSLFPGALVQGSGLVRGQLNPIGGRRAPATITLTSLEVGAPPLS